MAAVVRPPVLGVEHQSAEGTEELVELRLRRRGLPAEYQEQMSTQRHGQQVDGVRAGPLPGDAAHLDPERRVREWRELQQGVDRHVDSECRRERDGWRGLLVVTRAQLQL